MAAQVPLPSAALASPPRRTTPFSPAARSIIICGDHQTAKRSVRDAISGVPRNCKMPCSWYLGRRTCTQLLLCTCSGSTATLLDATGCWACTAKPKAGPSPSLQPRARMTGPGRPSEVYIRPGNTDQSWSALSLGLRAALITKSNYTVPANPAKTDGLSDLGLFRNVWYY